MRFSRKVFPGMVAAFLMIASPLGAFTLIESNTNQKVLVARGDTFRVHVQLAQVALCDGSVKLQPGAYNVDIVSMGDGSVRASFFDQTGRKAGEAHGIIAIIRPAAAAPATNLPSMQSKGTNSLKQSQGTNAKVSSPVREAALNFTTAGFDANSRSSFAQQGLKLNLEIPSRDGSRAILIGLLLPAVQTGKH
jgi:hypothetical protein